MGLALSLISTSALACSGAARIGRFFTLNMASLVEAPQPVHDKVSDPVEPRARLAALWVGHATVLLQMDDKFVLTDPVFTDTVGQLSGRLVEPGIDAEALPPLDAVVISHLHFDHLSLGSLDLIEGRTRELVLPKGGSVYVPRGKVLPTELASWQSIERDGLRITAVPVAHNGWRYAADSPWMTTSYTGYVIEYHGLRVYFAGDTASAPQAFQQTRRRFGHLHLALLPIAPIEPRDFMCRSHLDPAEALAAFELLGADHFMPIHFDTFINSFDEFGAAPMQLARLVEQRGMGREVVRLRHGQRHVFISR
jgi:L-ascorbate metabolism protein UlaG (beta-lactamase superfamily)